MASPELQTMAAQLTDQEQPTDLEQPTDFGPIALINNLVGSRRGQPPFFVSVGWISSRFGCRDVRQRRHTDLQPQTDP